MVSRFFSLAATILLWGAAVADAAGIPGPNNGDRTILIHGVSHRWVNLKGEGR